MMNKQKIAIQNFQTNSHPGCQCDLAVVDSCVCVSTIQRFSRAGQEEEQENEQH